ncbi:transmembrane channel-like protein 7 [Mercenaria mercenaria]|uniref:transmembrane channel-like protein 7 n=1 Tax=Mercenaria mercenaria TaxID=6596 RepID=UPI00234ECC23|nr:transmembrane channel-like protein 7 [Mercenaria mercenaria]
MTRVSPTRDEFQLKLADVGGSDWGDEYGRDTGRHTNGIQKGELSNSKDNTKSTVRRRRRRSFEPGSEDYAAYVEKRVFNKRHAWTPYLWERKRDKRLMGNLNPTKGWKGWKHRQKMRWNSIKLSWREWMASLELWRHSLKRIEGHQGTGVVSYFVFLKFLLFLNVFIFLATFIVVIFFQVAFDSTSFTKETTGFDNSSQSPGVILSQNCTTRYQVNETSGFQVVLDLIQGTGWMETTSFFYGYYGNTEVSIPGGLYNIPFAYCITTLIVLIVSLLVMVHYTFTKYTDTIVSTEILSHKSSVFFISVCCGWDYRIFGDKPVLLQHKHMFQRFCGALEDQKHELEKKESTSVARFFLWVIRIVVNVLILILLGATAAAIYYAQTFSAEFTTSDKKDDYNMIVQLFVQFLPSLIIAAVNAVYPIIFLLVAKLEKYRPSFVIKITLLRVVFVRLAALMVVTMTIYVEVTCSTHDECYIGTGDCPAVQCWETYFGQQIYKFFVVEFACDLLLTLLYELPRKLVTTKVDWNLAKKIGPAEFDIAISVLDLVYGQALCWLGFFFVPLLPALTVIRLVILFYLKMLSALYNTVPPQKPYQAARSNAFFMIVLLITFFLVAIPMGYVLVELQPSPMCGPFRIYSKPTEIVDIQIDLAPEWFKTTWVIITSSAFITGIILILGLALSYCSALRTSNKKLIKSMKGQLMQDEKDKQYLVLQLSKYTGGTEQSPETNKLPPPTYTVKPKAESFNQLNDTDNRSPHIPEKPGSPKGVVVQVNTQDEDW